MAARENQGLQIWLIIFAALWVISTGLTYWFYSKWQGEQINANSIETRLTEANNKVTQAENQSTALKELLGFGENEGLDNILGEFANDKDSYAKGYPEDQQKSYRALMKAMHASIQAAQDSANDSKLSATQTKAQLAAVEGTSQKRISEFEQELQKAQGTLGTERGDWNQSLTKAKTATQQHAVKSAQYQTEVGELKVEIKTKEAAAQKEINQQQETIKDLGKRIVRITDENFESPDGRIMSVDQRTGVVIINLGSEDALPAKNSFKVYSVDESDAHKSDSKGSIEVTRILGEHMAEARITSDDPLDPILPQDMVYSPLWSPGRQQRVALAGLLDIDGDGLDDSERLRRIIELNGGVIDAQMKEDGSKEGEMTLNTRFLIVGKEAEIAEKADQPGDAGQRQEATAFGSMVDEATSLSVTVITVDKFLDHLGWKEQNRTVALDQFAKGEEFTPRPPVAAKPGSQKPAPPAFKRRSPRAY